MKSIIIFLLFLSSVVSAYAQTKILSYDINLKYNNAEKNIAVSAVVNIECNKPVDDLELLCSSNNKIKSVKKHEGKKYDALYFKEKGADTIIINFNESVIGKHELLFEYIYPVEDTVIILDRGHRWYPLIADNIVTYKMNLEVPEGFIALTSGNLVSEEISEGVKKISFESNVPVFKLPVFIAPEKLYSVKENYNGSIKTCLYLLADNTIDKDSLESDIFSLLTYFSSKIGEYRFERFNLVEAAGFDGANLGSSFITIGSNDLKYYSKGNKDIIRMSIASQWIGAGVFPKLFCKGFWFLSISLPHYLRLIYTKDTDGEEAFSKALNKCYESYKKIEGTENELTILDVDYPNTKEKGILLYGKGVIVLHKLREQMGDIKWTNFLKEFYSGYNGKCISLEDVISFLDMYDSEGNYSKSLVRMLGEKGL